MFSKTSLATLTIVLFLAGTAAAWSHSGRVLAGGLGVGLNTADDGPTGHDGLTGDRVVLPAGSGGLAFTLAATGGDEGVFGAPDFDVCFETASGVELGCHFSSGDESGTVPVGSEVAWIYLYDGLDATYALTIG